jgi:hypothetical protein
MAENKYSRMAQIAQQYQATEPQDEPGIEMLPGKVGRPPGKSSNSAYGRRTVLLRKQTIKTAERLWEDLEPDKDFSDLIEQLVVKWIAEQQSV